MGYRIDELENYTEEDAIQTILDEHPELRLLWENLSELFFEPVINGVNPVAHVYFEAIAETQIATGDPPEARDAMERLLQQGYTRHAARGAVAALLIPHLYDSLQNRKPFDIEGYTRRLRVLGTLLRLPERNDLCFCGSGWKYKRCCGPLGSIMTPSRFAGRLILGYGAYAGPEVLVDLPHDDPLLQLENKVYVADILGRNGLAEAAWAVLEENLSLVREWGDEKFLKRALQDLLELNHELEMELGGRAVPVVEELIEMATGEEELRDLLCDRADFMAAGGAVDEAHEAYRQILANIPHWHFGRYRYALFLLSYEMEEEGERVLRELVAAKETIDAETYREARGMLEDMMEGRRLEAEAEQRRLAEKT